MVPPTLPCLAPSLLLPCPDALPLYSALRPPPASLQAQSALEYYFGQVDLVDSKGNVLVPNGTDCDAELTAALLRQVADIDIASGLLLAWVS